MPRRFFRNFAVKRDKLTGSRFLAPFDHLLHDGRIWGVRRRTVVPAFAMGLFVAFVPLPGHLPLAALLAIALHINLPVAVVATQITNPLTAGPLYYFAFEIGSKILGLEPRPFNFELSFSWFRDGLVYVWQPLVLGCLLLGAVVALVGYVGLDLLWRASISDYLARRRKRESARTFTDE